MDVQGAAESLKQAQMQSCQSNQNGLQTGFGFLPELERKTFI